MENDILENDSFHIDINDKWALGADSLQWILKKKVTSKGKVMWIGQSFHANEKIYLFRSMREKGVIATPEAMVELEALPASFREFKEKYNPRSKKGRKKAITTVNPLT